MGELATNVVPHLVCYCPELKTSVLDVFAALKLSGVYSYVSSILKPDVSCETAVNLHLLNELFSWKIKSMTIRQRSIFKELLFRISIQVL